MKAAAASATAVTVKTILFPTDFSDASKRAQSYATALANRFRAKLLVLHAKDPRDYNLPPETWERAEDADARKMKELQKSIASSFPSLKSELCFGEGTAWQIVESALAKHTVDLIVLGTRGRTGIGKLLLGSHAEEIFRHAACPVLTVGPRAQGVRGGEKELREVLYATDFSPESQAAAPYAVSIALALEAHLNLLHVVEEPKVGELISPTEVMPSSERLLRTLVPEDTEFWRDPLYFVERGLASDKILEVAERIPASLIVLGVRKPPGVPGAATHLGIGLAHRVVAAAACPVLTVRR
ncbi:MAG TPA: universal stress protein [Candidatus Acidoferrales bacterium]